MNPEITSILAILVICTICFFVLDLLISGILSWVSDISFISSFKTGLLSLLLPPIFLLYGILIERNVYRVKEVVISYENLPEAFDNYQIVHLSDIHARSFSKRPKSLARAVRKINSLNADMIAFSGDLITLSPNELDNVADILSELESADGIYSVLGNHDYSIYRNDDESFGNDEDFIADLVKREKAMGWDVLLDEHRIIRKGQDSIAVIGVENTTPSPHFPSMGHLSKASAGTEGMFRILLSHDPMHWDAEIVGQDYPLTLSGHTHAMQFSILGWCPSRYIFKQYRGLYTKGQQHLHVNTGLGETILPIRIGVPPEITLIRLEKK